MRKKVRPATFASYFTMLRTLFRYLVEEGVTEESPVESIKAPVFRKDQVQPFTQEQVNAMLGQARQSKHRRRDEVIVLFLLDTGVGHLYSGGCEARKRLYANEKLLEEILRIAALVDKPILTKKEFNKHSRRLPDGQDTPVSEG